jgi:hypothetical protein
VRDVLDQLARDRGRKDAVAPGDEPVLVALGAITWWQFAISVALIVLSTLAVARLAMRVYRTATLRTGARVRLRDLVPLAREPLSQ